MMQYISKNPYRILGLLANSTKKEQAKQVNRLKHFIEAEVETDEDFSFPSLGQFDRTQEILNEAVSTLNLDQDRMTASLFWFYNNNPITDEPAFNALKVGDFDQAINIWTKLIINSGTGDFPPPYYEISKRNASAYFNLGTLYLGGILEGHQIKFTQSKGVSTQEKFNIEGIKLKLKFIESSFMQDLKVLVTDETYKITQKELQLSFLTHIQSEFEKNNILTSQKFLEIISNIDFIAKEDFINAVIQKPIELIEKKIDDTKNKRKENKPNSIKYGKDLYNLTIDNLNQLKSILGISNHKYISISDKIANEIIQCSIDYYNDCQDKDLDKNYVKPALELAKIAEKIVVGNLTKDRINETIETYDEMKEFEYTQAISLLNSIKNAFNENKIKIEKEVSTMRLGYNQTVNWTKVNQMIANSLDWDKVVTLLQEKIPQKHIDKIKEINDNIKINEFKNLVNFVYNKLGYLQKKKIKYILYWDDSSVLPTGGDVENIPDWAKWIGGIILFIIFIKACN
jgi:hypothetical protein